MGWPRKNDDIRLYQEKGDKSFLMVLVANGTNGSGSYDAIANAFDGSSPTLASAGVDPLYLLNRCRRVAWSSLPDEWQEAFRRWFEPDWKPEDVRGLWEVA